MKIIQLIIWFMMVTGAVMAQEVVTKLDVIGQGIINEELRRTRSSTSANGASIVALQAELASKFPVTIANGGTGQDTAQEAIDALLPSQGSNSGKFLTTNGTNASWGAIPSQNFDLVSTTTFTNNTSTGNITIDPAKKYKVFLEAGRYSSGNITTIAVYLGSSTATSSSFSAAMGGTGEFDVSKQIPINSGQYIHGISGTFKSFTYISGVASTDVGVQNINTSNTTISFVFSDACSGYVKLYEIK